MEEGFDLPFQAWRRTPFWITVWLNVMLDFFFIFSGARFQTDLLRIPKLDLVLREPWVSSFTVTTNLILKLLSYLICLIHVLNTLKPSRKLKSKLLSSYNPCHCTHWQIAVMMKRLCMVTQIKLYCEEKLKKLCDPQKNYSVIYEAFSLYLLWMVNGLLNTCTNFLQLSGQY